MSYKTICGRQIEILATYSKSPGFFEPKPVNPKTENTFVAESNFTIHASTKEPEPILGKRSFSDAFYATFFDDARYGQYISPVAPKQERRERDCESKYEEVEQWREYYLANKNLFNV